AHTGGRSEDGPRPLRVAQPRSRPARQFLHADRPRRNPDFSLGLVSHQCDLRTLRHALDRLAQYMGSLRRGSKRGPGRLDAWWQAFQLQDGAWREPRLAARCTRGPRRYVLVLRQRRYSQGALPVARDRALARHTCDDSHARLELRPLEASARAEPG